MQPRTCAHSTLQPIEDVSAARYCWLCPHGTRPLHGSGSIEEVQCTRDKDMQEGQASPGAPISDTEVGAQLFTLDVFPEVIRDLDILVAGVRVEVKRLSSTLRA